MQSVFAAVLLVSCYFQAVQSAAATNGKISVGVDSQAQIMRKQDKEVGRHGQEALDFVEEEQATMPKFTKVKSEGTDLCNDYYVFGVPNTNDCLNPQHEFRITDEAMCEEAMEELKLNKSDTRDFLVPNSDVPPWTQRKPKGCFQDSCDATSDKKCMFMNAYYGDDSNNVAGTPVCYVSKLLNGTMDYYGGSNGGCPTDYQVIMNETICDEASKCLGDCNGYTAGNFRISETNNSRYNDYPEGCFINSKDNCVYINKRPAMVDTPPSAPFGMPICIIKTHFTTANADSYTNPADAGAAGSR